MRGWLISSAMVLFAVTACNKDETRAPTTSTTSGVGGSGGLGGSMNVGAGGTVIPDTPCDDVSAASVEVYPPGSAMNLERLASVGSRWAASGFDGYVFFDRDGGNADAALSQLAPNWNVIVSEGENLGVAASTDAAIQYQRLDEEGMAVTGPRGMNVEPPLGLTVAADGGASLVAWGQSTRLFARGVGDDGIVASDRFEITPTGFSSVLFMRSAGRDDQFAIVWTGDATLGVPETFVALTDLTSSLGEPKRIFSAGQSHEVVDVVATDEGYAVVLTGEQPEFVPIVVTLDDTGEVTASGLLEGAQFAFGLASLGDSFAVVAGRASGEVQVRGFDEQLDPAGPWHCVGDSYDDAYPPSVAPDDDGVGTLFTRPDGSVALHRLADLSE